MLRFAPSPTRDMDINSLRIALLNYIVSKQRKEDFIVRIEDTQTRKNIEGKDQEILDLLALFSIPYTQVIYQSQNTRFHAAMALQLLHEKKAFSCFCSPDWIAKKQEEAKETNKEYSYDDACKNLPAELVIDNTNPFTVRLSRPDSNIILHDILQGDIEFDPNAVDSFMMLKQDKNPMPNFASAVDDMLNDISFVIRSNKNIQNTPKHIHARSSLKYDKQVEYAHIPDIEFTNEKDGDIKSLLEAGYLPEAILNYLVSVGNKTPKDIFSLDEAIEFFDITKLSNKPIRFDLETLKEINKEHMKNLDPKELSRYVGFADSEIGELAKAYLGDISTTKELKEKIEPIFKAKKFSSTEKEQIEKLTKIIKSAPYFGQYVEFESYIVQNSDIDTQEIQDLLMILFTGSQDGPDIAKVYQHLKNYIGEIVK